eukprot:CAMPEP_0197631886 /NCGR_PEP_ID=MMETSP1338-20131121/8900_1 /TAXON_ID=43686 ORGANISM="Pelagodinium beii, Strain RCC1491" /NCGR_SAMPLE_ID=MMETSP1338 /ASSEMBLY_ACC=CAM_ASM_000754 /LENGTH=78 /DNA_ID=CAMNT_0043203427 /DNA_START=41 /DNA_END=273 /DNA_ORIENTATION=+
MTTPCIHFARGFCAKGQACTFNHSFQIGAIPADKQKPGGTFPPRQGQMGGMGGGMGGMGGSMGGMGGGMGGMGGGMGG